MPMLPDMSPEFVAARAKMTKRDRSASVADIQQIKKRREKTVAAVAGEFGMDENAMTFMCRRGR